MADEQNVVVKGGVVGDLATTSYGPRSTNKSAAHGRPMSWSKRELVIQMDGDIVPAQVSDFDNDTLHALPKGCFIVSAVAYSATGATISVGAKDSGGAGSNANIGALAPGGGAWAAVRDVDLSIALDSQIEFTIGAGETATVVIEFFQAEEGVDGVLFKV